MVPVLGEAGRSTGSAALVEDDQDYLGFRMRTLVTERYRLTVYSGRPYGELFDLREDPGELRNRWDDPGSRGLRDDLRVALLDTLLESGHALPRQLSRS